MGLTDAAAVPSSLLLCRLRRKFALSEPFAAVMDRSEGRGFRALMCPGGTVRTHAMRTDTVISRG